MNLSERAKGMASRKNFGLIWILGAKNDNADKSIQWDETFPNLADPDTLIVNLNSLDRNMRDKISKNRLYLARDGIWGRFVTGGTIIFITTRHPEIVTQYLGGVSPLYQDIIDIKNGQPEYAPIAYPIDYLCPFEMETYDVPEGSQIIYRQSHPFSQYLKNVKKFDFFLLRIGLAKLSMWLGINPIKPTITLIQSKECNITDKAGNLLGAKCRLNRMCKGTLFFLPPTSEVPLDEGINDILEACGRTTKEIFPEWTSILPLH